MLAVTTPSLVNVLGHVLRAALYELGGSNLASQVSVALVAPSGDGNDALNIMTRLIEVLPVVQRLVIFFPYRSKGWKDSALLQSNAIRPAINLRRASITSGTFGAMAALVSNAPALEHLTLNFFWMAGVTETDMRVSAEALPCLRRLILGPIDTLAGPKVVSQILASSGSSLHSLTINASMKWTFEALRRSANSDFAGVLVHLALMADDATQSSYPGGCEHSSVSRRNEVLRACDFIRACPRLAHLSLQGFHAADLLDILATVNRPLVSLAIQGKTCDNIIASTTIRPMFEGGHRAVFRLRLLVLHRDAIDPDWMPVSKLCRKQRTMIRYYGDLVSLMARRGVSKFRALD